MAKVTATAFVPREKEQASVAYAEEVRLYRVEIELPDGGNPTISCHRVRVPVVDDEACAPLPEPALVRTDSGEALVSITDPVTNAAVTISVAGILLALRERHDAWHRADAAK